jgi:plastocyanin
MSKTTWTIIIIILLALGAWFWFSGPSEAPTVPTPVTTGTPDGSFTTLPASVKEFTVTGKNFSFEPKTLTVNNGDTVKITFKNVEGFHDLKIDEFNAATKQLQANKEETITFVANKTGSFEYYCSVGTHRQMGMKGALIVK